VPKRPHPSRTQRTALVGLAVNFSLAVLKLIAGVVGHSYALIADAIESIADIVGSVVIWSGLRVGARPADGNHPYGHGKAEALAALVVAVLIAGAGIAIGVKAVDRILTPHPLPAWWTLAVLVAVVAIKEALSRYAAGVARREGNTALAVEAGHHRADVVTSVAAFIGISVALLGQRYAPAAGAGGAFRWESADDIAAILAALIIVFNGCRLARLPLRELMDAEPTVALDSARTATLTVPGVLAIEKCRGRTSGSRHYIELHVEVAPDMTVADAHIITGKIKTAVRAALPTAADIHIHVEPHEPPPAAAVPPGTDVSGPRTRGTDIHPNH